MSLPTVHPGGPRTLICTLDTDDGAVLVRVRTEGNSLRLLATFIDGNTSDTQFLWTTFIPNDGNIDVQHQCVRVPGHQDDPFTISTEPPVRYSPEDNDPPAPPYAPSQSSEGQPSAGRTPFEEAAESPGTSQTMEESETRPTAEDSGSDRYWRAVEQLD